MSAVIIPLFKRRYEQAIREENPFYWASKGHPATRDPAADHPQGVLNNAFSLLRYFKYYARAASTLPENPNAPPVPSPSPRTNPCPDHRFSFLGFHQ